MKALKKNFILAGTVLSAFLFTSTVCALEFEDMLKMADIPFEWEEYTGFFYEFEYESEQTQPTRDSGEPTTADSGEETTGEDEEDDPSIERTGDIDGDGEVTASDARIALRLSVGLTFCTDEIYRYADADGDGNVTPADARIILRVAVGLDKKRTLAEYRYWSWDNDDIYVKHFDSIQLFEKETYNINIDILTKPDEKVVWSSSVPSVAKVDGKGKITAVSKGYTCIIASAGNAKYCFDVTVLNDLQKKIYALQEKYPDGYYWNKNEKSKKYPAVSEIPCPGHPDDYSTCLGQCAGFAYLLSDEIFGNAPYRFGLKADNVKIGDYIRLKPSHSVFVIDVVKPGTPIGYDAYEDKNILAEDIIITVAECNWGWCCDIKWGRVIHLTDEKIISEQSFSRCK